MRNQIAIRCADGTTVFMNRKSDKSPAVISCKNIIAGIMVGSALLASAVIACACM